MKKNRIASALSLLIIGLATIGSVKVMAGGQTSLASRLHVFVADLLRVPTASEAPKVMRLQASTERITIQNVEQQKTYLNLSESAKAIQAEYAAGAGVSDFSGDTRAHALATADFDEDGMPDLVSGYTAASGAGVITLQRGNVDAIYPNSQEARERRARGEFTDAPFHKMASAFSAPEAANFVGAGDFDADGHFDVVVGRKGSPTLYFLRGDGRGNLAEAEQVELPGALTVMTTGEVNRRDGLTDIIVAINSDAGALALVFESPTGALRGQPETFVLPAAASGLALGALDAAATDDLAIAAGNRLLIVHGRDRRLSVDESSRGGVPEAKVSSTVFEYVLAGVTVGDFAGDEDSDIAVLSTDGMVQVLVNAESENSAKTNPEKTSEAQTEQGGDGAAGTVKWQWSKQASARLAEGMLAEGSPVNQLVTAKISSLAKDDLLVMDGGRVHVVTNKAAKMNEGENLKQVETESIKTTDALSVTASIGAESPVAAAVPMRLNSSALSSLIVLGANSKVPSVVNSVSAVKFTVNSAASTKDLNRGDGECKDSAGNCSLPAAIEEVYYNSGTGPFEINFNIPGAGVPVINTSYSLIGYEFFKPVIIDGTTQPAGRVEVVSNGTVFTIGGGNSTVRGLVISGANTAIYIRSAGNNVIEGNYFSTNAVGSAVSATRNETDVYIETSNNLIGGTTPAARNIISGATGYGINIVSGTGNLIRGNYIGTNAAGTSALSNRYGILVTAPNNIIGGAEPGAGNLISGNGAGGGYALYFNTNAGNVYGLVQGNLFGTNASGDALIGNTGVALFITSYNGPTTIGGTTPAARNVISGSTKEGIYITSFGDPQPSSYVQGNYIGTSADGTLALPNLGYGISLDRAGITVGGTAPGAGNLISGNGDDGINLSGFYGSKSHIIQGNLVGTDVSGTLALPNQGDGIEAFGADDTLIGGTTPEARNVISGNRQNGIRLFGVSAPGVSPLRVEGNYIGLNRFGTGPLGNGWNGVFTISNNEGNHIGGTNAGAGNIIAFNAESGIASNRSWITGPVLSNSIHSNGELGIDINENGVSPISNDSNANRPELLSVTNTEAGTTITGKIYNYDSLEPYTIQFFSNSSCDPSGYGEGQTLIGQATVPAPTKFTYINFSATISPAVQGSSIITAVNIRAANPYNAAPNILYTSEFSNCVQLAAPTPTPTPTPAPTPTPEPNATPTPSPTPGPTPTPAPLQLFIIAPARGGDAGAVTRQLTGQGFQTGATARLTRAGQSDIIGTSTQITNNGTTLTATFDLAGKARGLWSVVVTNPDGGTATLVDAFTIGEARAADVWVDVIGRYTMRSNREQAFHIAYGNSGDIDAPPTLIEVHIPVGFSIAQLPEFADGTQPHVVSDGGGGAYLQFLVPNIKANSAIYHRLVLKTSNDLAHTNMQLKIRATSSESLQSIVPQEPIDPNIRITPNITLNTPDHVKMDYTIADAEGTDKYSVDVTMSDTESIQPTEITVVENEETIEFEITVSVPASSSNQSSVQKSTATGGLKRQGDGIVGTLYKIYGKIEKWLDRKNKMEDFLEKEKKLRPPTTAYKLQRRLTWCLRRPEINKTAQFITDDEELELYNLLRGAWFISSMDLAGSIATALGKGPVAEAASELSKLETYMNDAWLDKVTSIMVKDIADNYDDGMSQLMKKYNDREFIDFVYLNQGAIIGDTVSTERSEIQEGIFRYILEICCRERYQSSDLLLSASAKADSSAVKSSSDSVSTQASGEEEECGCKKCDQVEKIIDTPVVFSYDPNDKTGPQGAGTQHYITGTQPLSYSIFFENKPEATAPAQDVIITDQLDLTKYDLSTFQIGPVAFGKDKVVTPPPGLSQWTTDVDLRPASNLIVRINAGLNVQTGLVTWAFTSLDPATGLPTEDPLAGFLPPNKTAPEGEGSVLFTISPKDSLQTGAEIRNRARIVFDTNPHIDTPEWLNTIDKTGPSSQVQSLAPSQCTSVLVQWSGTDTGSGIASYTVFVSDNGGPFTVWKDATTDTSSYFIGEAGHTYTFYSVARDAAGNIEGDASTPDAATTINTSITLSATSQVFASEGGTGSVNVSGGANCGWASASNDSWISISSGANGTGNGTVGFTVAPNSTDTARIGRMVIAGQVFTVTQEALASTPTPTPTPSPTPTPTPVPNLVGFDQSSYNIREDIDNTPQHFGSLVIGVTRSGDTSIPATVQFFTSDQSGGNECNQITGTASQRCDYTLVSGTLRFGAGEATKTISVPIIDDGYVEGDEVFSIHLQNGVGTSPGTINQATVTITEDNDPATTGQNNPYLNNEFFVRQNYLDFLSREPDSEGWATWPAVLNSCGPEKGFIGSPLNCDRAHVAHGFIASREFTEKGYLAYRMYEVALSRLPRYAEFIPDMAAMSGAPDSQELQQNTQQFAEGFTSRQEFMGRYADVSATSQAAQLIARLEQNAGVTLPATNTTLPGQPTQYGRQELINLRLNGTFTVGQTLRAFVEQKVVYDSFFERGFVTMQYFGFLRRDPDLNDQQLAGWKEWVFVFTNGGAQRGRPDILPRDYHHLTFGFIYSEEYRKRFGAP